MVNRPNSRSRLPRVLLLSLCIACGLLYLYSARKSLLRPLSDSASEEDQNSLEGILGIEKSSKLKVGPCYI